VITSVLQLILEHLKHRDESVAFTAAEVLTGLTVLIDSFNEINMVCLHAFYHSFSVLKVFMKLCECGSSVNFYFIIHSFIYKLITFL
jgi:hypothetical protein